MYVYQWYTNYCRVSIKNVFTYDEFLRWKGGGRCLYCRWWTDRFNRLRWRWKNLRWLLNVK